MHRLCYWQACVVDLLLLLLLLVPPLLSCYCFFLFNCFRLFFIKQPGTSSSTRICCSRSTNIMQIGAWNTAAAARVADQHHRDFFFFIIMERQDLSCTHLAHHELESIQNQHQNHHHYDYYQYYFLLSSSMFSLFTSVLKLFDFCAGDHRNE